MVSDLYFLFPITRFLNVFPNFLDFLRVAIIMITFCFRLPVIMVSDLFTITFCFQLPDFNGFS